MIQAINTIFTHDGRSYHLQAEDQGSEAAFFEVRVYDSGAVLWMKRLSYAKLLADEPSKTELERALRQEMEKTLRTLQAAIAKGKLP